MNAYTIDLNDETETLTEADYNLVRNVLETALRLENIKEESEVSVTFVSNEQIHELNKRYRGKDYPTDVLSFALSEGEEEITNETDIPDLLGDIIISVPKAKEQALQFNHHFHRELCFLAVHGLLHLLGYDHDSDVSEQGMFKRQEEILSEHGLKK